MMRRLLVLMVPSGGPTRDVIESVTGQLADTNAYISASRRKQATALPTGDPTDTMSKEVAFY